MLAYYILAYALLGFSFAACLSAFVVGGAAERLAAVAILLNLLAGMANEAFFKDQAISLVVDAATALVLLPIAVRYQSGWLGVVMILYAFQFALHAGYAMLDRPRDLLHARLNNIDFLAINVCLLAGTVLAWRRRRYAPAA